MTELYALASEHWIVATWVGFFGVVLVVALYDILQRKHAVLHNYPVIGHFRYWLELIGPELRQYIVASDNEEQPFNRDERSWIYASSKSMNTNTGFGTVELLYSTGYPIIKNAAFPFGEDAVTIPPGGDKSTVPCLKVMGLARGRRRPFRPASVVNISAMSFGALGSNAVSALNLGAAKAGCFHNTGEGGLSKYHKMGADIIWQLGTGYFGARDEHGRFSLDRCAETVAAHPQVRAIEIKMSQGAKPGKGGILPGNKVTAEIAAARGLNMGQDCISPNNHREFGSVDELIDFVEKLAERTGLPVGIKSAVGETAFWQALAVRMKERRQGPDFITIDGGEGGTGSAPLTFADHVSLPFKIGFARVYQAFLAEGIADEVVWIGSGKLGLPDRAVIAFAMGCDMINVAREALMSIGCIQSRKCHTGHCPTGVTTNNPWLQAGLNVQHKSERAANYLRNFRKELLSLAHAAGYEHPCQFVGKDIELSCGVNKFSTIEEVMGYQRLPPQFISMAELDIRRYP